MRRCGNSAVGGPANAALARRASVRFLRRVEEPGLTRASAKARPFSDEAAMESARHASATCPVATAVSELRHVAKRCREWFDLLRKGVSTSVDCRCLHTEIRRLVTADGMFLITAAGLQSCEALLNEQGDAWAWAERRKLSAYSIQRPAMPPLSRPAQERLAAIV